MVLGEVIDAWKAKSIILILAKNDLKTRYKSSVLGALWSFLEPVLIMTILFVVFSSILKNNISNYPLFLLLGIITFQMFSRSTTLGMESMLSKGGIVSSLKVPLMVFPLAASLTALYMMGFEMVIFFAFMVAFHFTPAITIIALLIPTVLLFYLGISLAIPFSVINVHYRDLRSIWTIVLQAAFFLTPVVYKLDFLPDIVKKILQFSPLVQLVDMMRDVALNGELPHPIWIIYTIGSISVIFFIGLVFFRNYKRNLVENL